MREFDNISFEAMSPKGLEGFAARVVQAIAICGVNQTEFARQVGVSSGFISEVVRGHKKPGAEFLHAVHKTFGISIDWLLSGEGLASTGNTLTLDLFHTIRLQVGLARSAVLHSNTTAKALLLLMRAGKLQEAAAEPEIKSFLDSLGTPDMDTELALRLFYSQLTTGGQQRDMLESAIAYFELQKPVDKVAALTKPLNGLVQINIGRNVKSAGGSFIEK